MKKIRNLHLLFPYHLNFEIATFEGFDPKQDQLLLLESWEFFTEPKHHQKKIIFLLSAMRHFAEEIKQKGYPLSYHQLAGNPQNDSFELLLKKAIDQFCPKKLIVTRPSDYRQLEELQKVTQKYQLELELREDNLFLSTPQEFARWKAGRKELRMEFFYREMRRKYQILMEPSNQKKASEKPIGGKWNYDVENRKFPKKKLTVPPPFAVPKDQITQEAAKVVERFFADHFGDREPFFFAVDRAEALKALQLFIRERLPSFGDYQDAMIQGEAWMYHSHLSFYLNCSLLTATECLEAAEKAYHDGTASLNAVEGFIRQILGWREYVRGIYWSYMPEYKEKNFLKATAPLPSFFWDGETKMNCLHQAIQETKQNAYAHHIQRLMVLGNFLLLIGAAPDEVNEWYHIVYADAFEWVELPNVTGMILFADGGILGSKPYAAGGSYLHKMSNYCQSCHYQIKEKNGPSACPFNYLYWNFLIQHQEKLSCNKRLMMPYLTLKKMTPEKRAMIQEDTKNFYNDIFSKKSLTKSHS